MPFAPIPGGKLYYETSGSGPPLLLVSGLGGTAGFWRQQAPRLAERFTVVVHDHRGVGRSSRDAIAYSIEQMAGDTLALMDHLDIGTAAMVGQSTGGAIGQHVANERTRDQRAAVGMEAHAVHVGCPHQIRRRHAQADARIDQRDAGLPRQ